MENNCSNCKFCIFIKDQNSPAGFMRISEYKCDNTESLSFNYRINIITSIDGILDGREKHTCNKYEYGEPFRQRIEKKQPTKNI